MTPQRRSNRVALWLWYRGDRFRGYQRQVKGPTVQEKLEQAFPALGFEGNGNPSGRTDLGVHARMQVVSLRIPADLPLDVLQQRLPPLLPEGLGLCLVRPTSPSFHAQWSCSGKEYRYRLRLGPRTSPGWEHVSWPVLEHPRLAGRSVIPERLAALLGYAVGTRDFIAFHAKSSPRKPRTLEHAELNLLGEDLYEVRLRGSGFGRYQARYLVGSSVAVAAGVLPEEKFRAALDEGEAIDGLRAPPEGLILWEVHYPPGLDPFSDSEREAAPGLPRVPPFIAS